MARTRSSFYHLATEVISPGAYDVSPTDRTYTDGNHECSTEATLKKTTTPRQRRRDPTEAEIQAAAEAIRETWTPRELEKRRMGGSLVPVGSFDERVVPTWPNVEGAA